MLIRDLWRAMRQISSLGDAHAFASSAPRGLRGLVVTRGARTSPPRPAQTLELFEFEACPFCRKVREALTELDLEYVSRTCAKGAEDKREEVAARGGKRMFPYLVDPNTGAEIYESEDIITYLAETYGAGRPRLGRALSPVNTLSASGAALIRAKGRRVRAGLERREQQGELLVLYNMESSPFCRKVREALNELNLDYLVKSVGKKSARRSELIERGGQMQVPYLVDPGAGVALYESDDILHYLERTYGSSAARTSGAEEAHHFG